MDDVLAALKAAGEPTRLRILSVLQDGELTVSELCRVLGQTQPRVSRHLKLLCDAGLLERHSEGTSAFFRLAPDGVGFALAGAVLDLLPPDDATLDRDLSRLDSIRSERAEAAAAYFEQIAGDWDEMRTRHVSDTAVEAAMLDAIAGDTVGTLLDLGTGTGRVLELFADRIGRGIGIDQSRQMLNLARTQLQQQGYSNCSVRHGNVYDLRADDGSVDVAVLHHVLHFLDDPAAAVTEAARTIRPGGRLLIVDFAPHQIERLREEYAHRRLGFPAEEITGWCRAAGLDDVTATALEHHTKDEKESLTVTLWVARRTDGSSVYPLGVAS